MKKIILTFRQFITALRVLKNLPMMQSDLYKVMAKSSVNADDVKSLSETLMSLELDVEDLDNRVSDNYREIENTQYNLEDKIDRYEVMDIVRDEADFIDRDDIYEYTLSEEDIRELVQEEMLEYTPAVSEDVPMISPEEYQNIINDVIREIVQRLEM